ncbi:glycosyltransferase family 1 protein [Waterburya agarophytonicola K14]|uniref:Glycosyltransferase family 1 protein n=1 Tax=Waterburya agarophytonicola KI4 TaxID=2874699 RepID=A0A964BSR6_9CYAN|nr:glycosyltransferase [Waterburya agarophytonicola]MCC0178464.1 glycosyltransferase family 1 protein [Waterburya agarophytonicola KI4]
MSINFPGYCNKESRTLVWSLRNIQNFIYNSSLFEFEDIINLVDAVDLIAPPQYDFAGSAVKRLVKTQTHNFKPLINLNPYFKSIDLEQEYDIFMAILDFPWNISSINLLKNLRQKCKFAVCYLDELWSSDLPKFNNCLKFFQDFDLICVGFSDVVENVRQVTNVPCIYLPSGIDTIKFYPDFEKDLRCVDICSLGRRSSVTHETLLRLAEEKQYYYSYDYISGAGMRNNRHQEHRTLTANLLKNSRYYITNYAKVNEPERTQGQMEMGCRFFEGAAAGNICIGKPPDTDTFRRYFDWEDAVIPIAFDEPHIDRIILELDSQPEYLRKIQINNVANSLRKHDWVYRWSQILTKLGLPSTKAMEERKTTLEQMAQSCEKLLLN